MFSTTTLAKSSKFTGKVIGTHQRLDQAARLSLAPILPKARFFPSSKEIIYFEGSRGPDGLKRKSPGIDEPSYMMVKDDRAAANQQYSTNTPSKPTKINLESALALQPFEINHDSLDARSIPEMIVDHHWNLVRALQKQDRVRAAFEAAWMAHAIVDGLTPAHHFPLSDVKEELMTNKELMKVFGQPIKGLMHGRSLLETMRNNWLYWGAGGHMSKHVAYEYGVLMIAAAIPPRSLQQSITPEDLQERKVEEIFSVTLQHIQKLHIYKRFLDSGWTTELATETKDVLLPEMVRAITLSWYSAAAEAYKIKTPHLPKKSNRPSAARESKA